MKTTLLKIRKIIKEQNSIDFLILFSFLVGISLLLLYLQKTKISQPKFGGLYREGLYEPVNSLNPVFPKNDSEKAILNIIYPPLIEFDNGRLISKFIESYSFSADYLTLNLELKDSLWSDGSKITTDDLIFSFDLYKKYGPAGVANNLKNTEIKAIDHKRAEIHLNLNDNYFLYNLAQLRILPAKDFSATEPENFNYQLFKISSGPFVFESLKTKKDITIITLKRNEFYQPRPYLDKVVFYVFPSVKSAFDALILKEIDGLAGINYFDLPQNLVYNYHLNKIILPRVIGIFFNSQKIDQNLVQSIYSLNLGQEIKKGIFKDNAEITEGLFSDTWRRVLNLPSLTITKNQGELKPFNLLSPNYYFYPEIARLLKEKLKIEVDYLDANQINEKLTNKDYQAILFGLNFGQPPNIPSFFSKVGYNINNLDNVELEKDFQQLMTDPKVNMNEKLADIETKLLKTNVFLVNPYYLYLLNKKFVGFDQFYLPEPAQRFVKIEFWYQK